jgi:hypothetical protein
MAQLNWTYYSLTGIPYSIDMYHGDESGHLILFVNEEIILIDFEQHESNTHSFIIENQLLELSIKATNTAYDYVLTPQLPKSDNIPKEKYFDEHFWIPLIILIIAINLLLLLVKNIF